MFAETISVCSQKDLAVWTLAAQQLPDCIESQSYSVYVPDHEVDLFKSVTNPAIGVYPESSVIGAFSNTVKNYLTQKNKNRTGWYTQQFIKLAAIARHSKDATVLIWDADTIPLKPLAFQDNKRLQFYTGKEHRQSYFSFTERALGLKKGAAYSFIAQCMPVQVDWLHALIRHLQSHGSVGWMDALLNHIDPSEPAGFSEYETIGTFVLKNYPDAYCIADRAWCRNGTSLVGGPKTLNPRILKGLSTQFDYISFEHWDQPHKIKNKIAIQYRRLYYTLLGLQA